MKYIGERPHCCHLCTATFIHQTDLRRHVWAHTGVRPLRCTGNLKHFAVKMKKYNLHDKFIPYSS